MSIPDFELLADEDAACFANHSGAKKEWGISEAKEATQANKLTIDRTVDYMQVGAPVVGFVSPEERLIVNENL